MHPSHPTTISRLRKGGLTRTVAAAAVAAVAASTALVTANAAVIYSGVVNTTVSNGTTQAINVNAAGANEFTLFTDSKSTDGLNAFAPGFLFVAPTTTANLVTKFAIDVPINGSSIYSTSTFAFVNRLDSQMTGQWGNSGDGYFGFQFNPTGNQVDYGWGHLTVSANQTSMTLVDYAYDDSGASILTGFGRPVPEPTTSLLCLGGGVALLGLLRRGSRRAVNPA